jgi:hypothetical protein
MGIMVDKCDVKESAIASKPFSKWPKGYPKLYGRIKKALEALVKRGNVQCAKKERAFVYWWNES